LQEEKKPYSKIIGGVLQMKELNRLEKQMNLDKEFFTAHVLEESLDYLLRDKTDDIMNIAKMIVKQKNPRLYFLGGGASLSAMMGAEYLLDKFTTFNAKALNGWEFLARDIKALNEETFVFLTSYSGETPELLKSERFAREKKATTIAISKTPSTPLARQSQYVIDYNSKAVYISPLTIVYLLSAYIMKYRNESPGVAKEIIMEVQSLPVKIKKVMNRAKEQGKLLANKAKNEEIIYVVAGGTLYGLGYKKALSVVIENLWIHGVIVHSGEFYHGPIEIIDDMKPAFMFLVGDDEAREPTERAINFCKKRGAPTFVFDVKDYPEFHPLFAPFALFIPTEWFVMFICALKNHDVDERRYMGRVKARWGEY